MTHPLVVQLRFTREEWARGVEGVDPEDGARHLGPMNCIGWIVGHLAQQEHRYWLERAQGKLPFPQLKSRYAFGAPMSTPDIGETRRIWREVITASESYLDTLTTGSLLEPLPLDGEPTGQTVGSALLRMIYHYWYHLGEIQAIRQMLGHEELPEYVGGLDRLAPYQP